jgi:hypothetical protein
LTSSIFTKSSLSINILWKQRWLRSLILCARNDICLKNTRFFHFRRSDMSIDNSCKICNTVLRKRAHHLTCGPMRFIFIEKPFNREKNKETNCLRTFGLPTIFLFVKHRMTFDLILSSFVTVVIPFEQRTLVGQLFYFVFECSAW